MTQYVAYYVTARIYDFTARIYDVTARIYDVTTRIYDVVEKTCYVAYYIMDLGGTKKG